MVWRNSLCSEKLYSNNLQASQFLELTQVIPYVASCLVKEPPDLAESAVALCGLDIPRPGLE